jgi:hypothetical protein
VPSGEVCVSLHTRGFREAEHRAALLDAVFDDALRWAKTNVADTADLRRSLETIPQRASTKTCGAGSSGPGNPIYDTGGNWATQRRRQKPIFVRSEMSGPPSIRSGTEAGSTTWKNTHKPSSSSMDCRTSLPGRSFTARPRRRYAADGGASDAWNRAVVFNGSCAFPCHRQAKGATRS